tara:strand:- start:22 stop:393 length:372 start_codon:yes stop_codon:yes gene_type:complete
MTNSEVVQGIYGAFAEGNMEKMASLFSENWVGVVPEGMPNSGTFHGAGDFIQNFLSHFPTVWPDFGLEPIALYESGDTVFLHHKITAGGKTTEGIHMLVIENGKCISWRPFDDTAALIAADQS